MLKTGDIAYVDEYAPGGIFHVVERIKELIKVKGNQVAPAELEGILLDFGEVADAAVVGVTINGEESPRAYVVRKEGSRVTEEEVARWMADKVARYKQLRGGVKFVDVIPKNPVSSFFFLGVVTCDDDDDDCGKLTVVFHSRAKSYERFLGNRHRRKLVMRSRSHRRFRYLGRLRWLVGYVLDCGAAVYTIQYSLFVYWFI